MSGAAGERAQATNQDAPAARRPRGLLRTMTPEQVAELPSVVEVRLRLSVGNAHGQERVHDLWNGVWGDGDLADIARREARLVLLPDAEFDVEYLGASEAVAYVREPGVSRRLIFARRMTGRRAALRYQHHLDVEYPMFAAFAGE